jgi:hypothetical protein
MPHSTQHVSNPSPEARPDVREADAMRRDATTKRQRKISRLRIFGRAAIRLAGDILDRGSKIGAGTNGAITSKNGVMMKSLNALSWVALVNLSLLVACGGVSKGDGPPGDAGNTGTTGGSTTGGNGQGGIKPGTGAGGTMITKGGKDSGPPAGSGSAAGPSEPIPGPSSCSSDADCPGDGEPCQMCADGHSVCHDGYCDGRTGTCKVQGGYCAVGCATDADCSVSNLPCTDCGDGAEACPTTECQAGFCEVSYPGCSDHDPCDGKGCGEECQACQGSGCAASVTAYCNKVGKCQPGPPNCGAARCLAQEDCGEPADCAACEGGGGACAAYVCRSELCQLTCTPSGQSCKVSSDCPTPAQCVKCVNGDCAVPACLDDACQMVCIAP